MRMATIFLLLMIAISCRQDASKKIIEPEQMKVVIWDMLNADSWHEQLKLRDTLVKYTNENFKFYNQIFAAHNITKEQFYNSYKYYQTNPLKMQALLDSATAYGERIKNAPVKPKLLDSLKATLPVKKLLKANDSALRKQIPDTIIKQR